MSNQKCNDEKYITLKGIQTNLSNPWIFVTGLPKIDVIKWII